MARSVAEPAAAPQAVQHEDPPARAPQIKLIQLPEVLMSDLPVDQPEGVRYAPYSCLGVTGSGAATVVQPGCETGRSWHNGERPDRHFREVEIRRS